MGEGNVVSVQSVMAHQYPSGQALLDGVTAIGESGLGGLQHEGPDIKQEMSAQVGLRDHGRIQVSDSDPEGITWNLNEAFMGTGVHAKEHAQAGHAVAAD